MEKEVKIEFQKEAFSDLEISRIERNIFNYRERFSVKAMDFTLILPQKPKIHDFNWVIDSISHEYLHLILAELENPKTCGDLDNLGYNLATGYNYREEKFEGENIV